MFSPTVQPLLVTLGSTSDIKRQALSEALCMVFPFRPVDIQTVKTTSGVNEQPVGSIETYTGAINRATEAWNVDTSRWAVGIESGIFREGRQWVDRAFVVLYSPEGRLHVALSEPCPFDEDDVETGRLMGFRGAGVGSAIAARLGGSAKDPHLTLTGRPRASFLEAAITQAFRS